MCKLPIGPELASKVFVKSKSCLYVHALNSDCMFSDAFSKLYIIRKDSRIESDLFVQMNFVQN